MQNFKANTGIYYFLNYFINKELTSGPNRQKKIPFKQM